MSRAPLRTGSLRAGALAGVLGLVVGLSACSGTSAAEPAPGGTASATAGADGAITEGAPGTALLAFAGDVHFEGTSSSTEDLGSAFTELAGADLAVVNLETAVTTGGTQVEKQFAFRAPPAAMGALKDAGVDAVSIANNHGMDFGASGLADTLEAGRDADLPVLGAGDDVDAAFTPLRVTLHGVDVSVIAATDVIDSSVETAWTATATRPGLASAKDEDRLLADVRTEARAGRVVVVFLHWGQERVQCPSDRQTSLATALAGAGADVVVGSHAHVLEPTATVGRGDDTAFVAYGMGNFHFYAKGGPGAQTGVLTVQVDRDGVVGDAWHPATIRSGKPELLSASALEGSSRSADELVELGQQCEAGGVPSASSSRTGGGEGPASPSAGPTSDAVDDGADAPDGADGAESPTAVPSAVPSRSATASAEPSSAGTASPSVSATP